MAVSRAMLDRLSWLPDYDYNLLLGSRTGQCGRLIDTGIKFFRKSSSAYQLNVAAIQTWPYRGAL